MLGLARGWNNKNNADNTRKLSPKWTYNFVNGGGNNGSWFTSNMDVLLKLGCPFWANFPYVGSATPSANILEWSRDPAIWRSAIPNRFSQVGRIQSVDSATGLANLKALLVNGYAILYATYINDWQYTTISNDPSTTADNALVGKQACWMATNTNNGGHAMTIVGYNDDVWIDINKNGLVDPGEKGALKIVNSWGNTWNGPNWNGDGSMYVAYDALRSTSAVAGVSNANRARIFWNSEVYWITARASYTPTLLGQFTLSHAQRNQLNLRVASSATTTTTPATYFPSPTAYTGWNGGNSPQPINALGGPYAFDGSTTAVSGTFVLDLTDLVVTGNRRYYVAVDDNAAGFPASLSDFRLTTGAGTVLATAIAGIPGTADASTARAYADFAVGAVPSITSPTTASAMVGQPFSYSVTASNGATSFGATGLPSGLSINTTSGAITGTPTTAGTYNVALSASNASGTGSGSVSIAVASAQITPSITSGSSASGTVGSAFSYNITATNSPTSFGATGLPPGLSVNISTGAITGTPTQSGTFSSTVTASNGGGTGTRFVSMSIAPAPVEAPVITSSGSASGVSGTAFSYRIQATNNPTSFGAADLPTGLSLNTSTGYITGNLPAARDYDITLSASNAGGSGYKTLVLSVAGNNIIGPPNDAFGSAIVLSGTSTSTTGTNINATAQSGEPSHAGVAPTHSVWWKWTAPASGSATIDTIGSNFDTVLAIYTGSSVSNLTAIASDDQSGGNNTSRVTFNAIGGTVYYIAVDGFSGAQGSISLNLSETTPSGPANDLFANSTTLSGATVSTTGSNVGATAESGEPQHAGLAATHSVWWNWTAPSTGQVTIDTIGSDFDTLLAIYTGSAVNALSAIASDDQSGGNNTSKVVFNVTAGVVYQIAVDGWSGDVGGIQLHIALTGGAPANDMFANRIGLSGSSVTVNGTNVNATAETSEPNHFGYAPQRSVWWTWTAPESGLVTLDTGGSNFDTVLAVYTGSSIASLASVVSNDDSGAGITSAVIFPVIAGTTYQIAVDGFAGASGTVVMHLALVTHPPNDDFASRGSLSGSIDFAAGSNVNATTELGEPDYYFSPYYSAPAQKSVWWTWTAPGNGIVTISTFGSDFDTILAVYTGSSVSSLAPVAANDDYVTDGSSQVSFYAIAGTAYQIAVDGYAGSEGLIILSLSQGASSSLYSTDFEDFPTGTGTLSYFDGWTATSDPDFGSYGTFTFDSQAAWIGYNPPEVQSVFAYRPINYDAVAHGTPAIRFTADIDVIDSTNGAYDVFGWALYNSQGDQLAAIYLDNSDFTIHYDNGTDPLVDTGVHFQNDQMYHLVVDINFATNTWSASLGGTPLFSNQPLHLGTAPLNLGDIDAFWHVLDTNAPGDNYMVFDNYNVQIAQNAAATPVITPARGTFRTRANVTIRCSTPGATIYYTTNGSTPTTSSRVYRPGARVAITGRGAHTIKAMAVAPGYEKSAVATARLIIR